MRLGVFISVRSNPILLENKERQKNKRNFKTSIFFQLLTGMINSQQTDVIVVFKSITGKGDA